MFQVHIISCYQSPKYTVISWWRHSYDPRCKKTDHRTTTWCICGPPLSAPLTHSQTWTKNIDTLSTIQSPSAIKQILLTIVLVTFKTLGHHHINFQWNLMIKISDNNWTIIHLLQTLITTHIKGINSTILHQLQTLMRPQWECDRSNNPPLAKTCHTKLPFNW